MAGATGAYDQVEAYRKRAPGGTGENDGDQITGARPAYENELDARRRVEIAMEPETPLRT
jgi:hypothetical protein